MTTAQALDQLHLMLVMLEAAKDLPDHVDELCDLRRQLDRLASNTSSRVTEQRARARGAT